ncbi:McrB family protein [Psychrobacillus sp. L3]|uniref:McrB family protein n=1 Tax=Psychrobacillus sp. L3 TaxID=3236891 RepID=UPI0036F27299
MNENLKNKEITRKKYFDAINIVSNEMINWGLDRVDIYSLSDPELINRVMSCNGFIEKNRRGNQMYSAALNHYKKFLISEERSDKNMVNIDDVVLIKINQSYYEDISPEDLYKVTSESWVVSLEKTPTRDIKYYCSIYNNIIIQVYELTGFRSDPEPGKEKRFILEGKLASEEIRKQLISLDVHTIHRGSGNPIKYTSLKTLLDIKEYVEIPSEDEVVLIETVGDVDLIDHIHSFITSKGFNYSLSNIKNLYLSLRSKPFVIISGISGTGKTKIVQLFAESIGAMEDNGQFKLIPVRPDWSDSSELLGYVDLKGEFQRGPMTEMVEHAMDHPNLPHFVLLDEMNLARVEYYFSDVLSVMESRKRDGDKITSSQLLDGKYTGREIKLPENLYIIGTVNMDETTHPFSKKVLDRANTIEFNDICLDRFDFLEIREEVKAQRISNEQLKSSFISLKDVWMTQKPLVEKVSQKLANINKYLESINAHVGYRVRDEICFYMVHNENAELLEEHEAFDFCVMQKILPRITGSDGRIDQLLENLFTYMTGVPYDADNVQESREYPRSAKKVAEMLRRYHKDGFTSFWIS